MDHCNHTALELLPERKNTLRCRHCHLTIAGEELADGFCPECFAASGTRRYDFEEVPIPQSGRARYKCEECGAIIESA
jgi:rubrerythrin